MIEPYKKDKDINIMIWGVIYENGCSDIVFMERDPDSNKSEEDYQHLFQVIHEAWDDIGQEAVVNLIKNMDTRINVILRTKGWYTRFWILTAYSGN